MTTRAAVTAAPEAELEIREVEVDDPKPDELRVGHEGAGVVEAVGSAVQDFAAGDKGSQVHILSARLESRGSSRVSATL